MVKYTQTIRRLLPTNCLSVFDHYVELAVKGLNMVFTIFMVFCLLKPALATLVFKQSYVPGIMSFVSVPYFAYLYNTNTQTPARTPH